MKLKLFDFFKSVFKRFPLTSVLIVISSLIIFTLVEDPFEFADKTAYALGLTVAGLYISAIWVLIIGLMGESGDLDDKQRWSWAIGVILFFGSLAYLFSYKNILAYDTLNGAFTGEMYKLIALLLVSIGSIFIIPFIRRDNSDVWSFVYGALKRLLISFLYALVLSIGLSLALGALDWFWEIIITENQYEIVMIISFPLVGLLHFIAGLPGLLRDSKWEKLPKFLDIFAKFIVIPLSGIYTVIMYPYIFSLPFRTEWPPNQTTPTVLAFLALGYGALFILYKGLSSEKDRFTKIYSRVLGAISIPMVLFWMYAVYLRTAEYGLTVNRVVLMTLVLWALGVSIYFVAIKEPKIKWVFLSLLVSMVSVIYLPFTSFFWSERVQIDRLVDMAKVEDIYVNEKIGRKAEAEEGSVAASMGETLEYLNQYNTLSNVQALLDDEVLEALDIDEYGYADMPYRGGEVFFDEFTYEFIPFDLRRQAFVLIGMADGGIPIPEGFIFVQKVAEYDYDNTQMEFEIEGYSFSIPKDFLDGIETTDSEFRELEALAADLTLTDGDDAVLIITSMSLELDGDDVQGASFIEGLLFTK